MKIIIIGGGETGLRVAKLYENEAEITIVEKDDILCKELTNKTNALILHGDGTDISILKEANIESRYFGILEKVKKVIPLVGKPMRCFYH